MNQDSATLERVLGIMARHHVLKLKMDGLELELHPLAFVKDIPTEQLLDRDQPDAGMCRCRHSLTEHGEHGLCLNDCDPSSCGPVTDAASHT